jgi:hypothetical protein
VHWLFTQYGVDPEQTTLQPPQFITSLVVGMHAPPQKEVPEGQA